MSDIPSNLKYTEDHEWALEEDDVVTVGITDFAQSQLGDIVFVELPEKGSTLEKGSAFGVVESIKSVSDLISPVSGEIIDINDELGDAPESLNESPYESWMIKVKCSNKSDLDDLLDHEKYNSICD